MKGYITTQVLKEQNTDISLIIGSPVDPKEFFQTSDTLYVWKERRAFCSIMGIQTCSTHLRALSSCAGSLWAAAGASTRGDAATTTGMQVVASFLPKHTVFSR